MNEAKLKELQILATKVRMNVIEGVYNAKSGHPGGSLSISDLLAYLYSEVMNVDPKNPKNPERDRLVLSKGHCAPGLYGILAEMGYFDKSEIKTLRQIGSILQGHPDMNKVPGVDMSSGSLGQGISAACGMALAGKIDNKDYRVYAIVGDGESEEGEVWEASMFAAHKKLDNLTVIIDYNGLQIDGPIEEVCSPLPFDKKFEAFGFHVITMDAHDFNDIERAFNEAKEVKGKPVAIIQRSVKGKGVSFMENKAGWHGKAPNDEEYEIAMNELKAKLSELEGK